MLGLVTIGQSPRKDVIESMFGHSNHPAITQAGALDTLDVAEIVALAPRDGEYPLVTVLVDGTEVVIAKERLTALMNDAIQRLDRAGATIICVLCTGEFSGLVSARRIVHPDRVLAGVVDALLPSGTLGVVIPHLGQRDSMARKWARSRRSVELSVVSPYDESGSFERAAVDLLSAGCDMIVLDCMGFSVDMQAEAQPAASVPVVLANGVVGAVLSSILPRLSGSVQYALRL
jgi:protein AroM